MTPLLRRPWRLATLALGVLVLGLAVAVAVVTVNGDGADDLRRAAGLGGDEAGELTQRHQDVARAAERLTLAFLEVDHRDMEPLTEKVLSLATGQFKKEYEASVEQLVESAERNESLSTGTVLALGVGEMDSDSAQVYVAADSEVKNLTTEGTTQPRYYRLRIDMVREDGEWLASQVQFVG